MRHEYDKPCPITGKEIPHNTIYTDHNREGIFNACGACGESKTPAERLQELKKRREMEV